MYIDTSAIIKLYTAEPDSDSCEATVAGATLVSSRLLHCEFRSALTNKEARKIVSPDLSDEIWKAFQSDVAEQRIRLIPLSDLIVHEAAELISDLKSRVPLRALDALHLATYLSIETGPLFTKDLRMRQAARHLGLALAG